MSSLIPESPSGRYCCCPTCSPTRLNASPGSPTPPLSYPGPSGGEGFPPPVRPTPRNQAPTNGGRTNPISHLTEHYTVVASNSTARSEAVLNYTFTKSDMGRKLVCLVEHVAYPTGSENSSVALDVLCKYSFVRLRRRLGLFDTFLADKPSVKIVRVDGGSVLEDGVSSLSLSCISESNPPAQVGSSRFSKEPTHLTI